VRVHDACIRCYDGHVALQLAEAIRRLREITGDSQQAFATRLGLSIRALVNYEKDRTPNPRALAALARLATKSGQPELAQFFWKALPAELQTVPILQTESPVIGKHAKMAFQMLPALPGGIPKQGVEIQLSNISWPLQTCINDLTAEADSLTADPKLAEKLHSVARRLAAVKELYGQKVRVIPVQVEFDSRKSSKPKT
jgi:transcriptional regulator with XRE-family HTH domain